ncbi:MAG: Pirin domain protein [Bacteroidetes bacterium]|jgi:redox-sensitive bicupin YhaK (pirin superfamily)|nr:Pirin domain protein [Bacteroidota bacterium]
MSENRKIQKIIRSKPTLEGAGVHLKRAFGFGDTQLFDPFLLFDDFRGDDPEQYIKGFPWHPHRGIETITYVLRGTVDHGDSMGNKGTIGPGDVQWMTAGSGIIHQEMPNGDPNGFMWGFQLWANLPASQKMMDPRYREVTHDQIPEVSLPGGVTIRVISGKVNGTEGPVRDVVIEPEYLDVMMPPNKEFTHAIPSGHTALAYIFGGEACFTEGRNALVVNEHLILFDDGEQVTVTTKESPVRFLLLSGNPIREPVAWHGPIVMNTQEELQIAMEEFRNGTFIKQGNK